MSSPSDADGPESARPLAERLWALEVPVLITHAAAPSAAPLVTAVPRLGYLALLLPRLTAYFGRPCSSFHHEGVLLRNLAVGLLVDLYRPAEATPGPWRLVVADGPAWDIHDTFLNSAKEADFVRNGNAKQMMKLSRDHTRAMWNAVRDNDYEAFKEVNAHLLNSSRELKNIPLRIYIPQSPDGAVATADGPGAFRVVQSLVSPKLKERTSENRNSSAKLTRGPGTPQTLGSALRGLLPQLFPSSRDPVLANVVLHGAPVPFAAPLEALMCETAYPDGWICLVVVPLDA